MERSPVALMIVVMVLSSIAIVAIPDKAEAGFVTGGQDVLLDPARPVIYWAGSEGNDLKFINSSTGETIESLMLGTGPSALCLDPNGTTLYISFPSTQRIVAVDVISRSVSQTITLSFSPLSIGLDGKGYAYVSGTGAQQGWLYSLDMNTWTVMSSVNLQSSDLVVEVNPAGTTLLAIEREVIPSDVFKYEINAGSFTHAGTANSNTHLPQQVAVDWSRSRLYITTKVGTDGIIIISTDTLGYIGSYPMGYFPSCVFITDDGKYVYGTSDNYTDPAKLLWMYNATDGSLMGTMDLATSATSLVVSHDLKNAYIGLPIQRISLLPLITPQNPDNGSVLSYTPRFFSVEFSGGLPNFEEQNASAYIDSSPLSLSRDTNYLTRWVYKAEFNSTLAEGNHTFSASQLWNEQLVWGNTTFMVDRDDPLAVGPSLSSKYPMSGSIVPSTPLDIVSQVVYRSSDQYFEGGVISLDGVNLSTSVGSNTISAHHGSNMSTGLHSVVSRVFWDDGLGVAWANWSFTAMNGPMLTPIFPAAGQVLTGMPDHIEVAVDRRDFQGTLSAPRVSLDGNYFYAWLTPEGNMVANLTKTLKSGNHSATATLTWVAGQATTTWNFELDMFVGPRNELLVEYQYGHEFRMLVPNGTDWSLEEDSAIEGEEFPVVMYGPAYTGFTTNIIVTGGKDPSVEESEEYLSGQLDEAIRGLEDAGYDVVTVVAPVLKHINNLTAYVAVIQPRGYGIYQAVAIIASEAHESTWVMILSIHIAHYNDYSDMFDRMVDSFTMDVESGSSLSDVELAALGIGIAAIGCGIAGSAFWLSRRRRETPPPKE